MAKCIAFLRVPDVEKTLEWYLDIGFKCLGTHSEPGCLIDWALLDWDGAQFMLYPLGSGDSYALKDAGLYIEVESIDELIKPFEIKTEVVELNQIQGYRTKEIVLKDPNGFYIRFAERIS